jgi:hypothetical protein
MGRSFKIVGRYTERSRWHRGKIGLQAKKRVYTSLADFERYAPDTAKRWTDFCDFDVEAYELIEDEWVACQLPEG